MASALIKTRPFLAKNYPDPPIVKHAGRECVLDRRRKILVPAGPEEIVRQKLVAYLVDDLGIPEEFIDIELSLSAIDSSARGRADVVVTFRGDEEEFPVLVVECKAPHVPLTDEVVDQVLEYDAVLACASSLVGVTNGSDSRWFLFDEADGSYFETHNPLTWKEMAGEETLRELESEPDGPEDGYVYPTDGPREAREVEGYRFVGFVGEGSPDEHLDFIVPLVRLIQREADPPHWELRTGHRVVKVGTRQIRFGNAAGGTWAIPHRYFLVADHKKEFGILGLSVGGAAKLDNDPRWGTTKGHTYLSVSVDRDDRPHHSLQLDLDRFVRKTARGWELWHDGRLTHGLRGAVKRADVLAYVAEHAPHLVRGGEVVLGVLPKRERWTWEHAAPVARALLEYGIVRHRFRRERERGRRRCVAE